MRRYLIHTLTLNDTTTATHKGLVLAASLGSLTSVGGGVLTLETTHQHNDSTGSTT